jgi:hypothetical protein
MPVPPRLEKEINELRKQWEIELYEDADFVALVLKNFPVGNGYSVANCDLLLKVPKSYPDAGPDMFWTDPRLTLANGQIPQSGEAIEAFIGGQWRRFSWHRSSWNPNVDNMHGHVEFVRKRLRDLK